MDAGGTSRGRDPKTIAATADDAASSTRPVSLAPTSGALSVHPRILERFAIGRCLGAGTFGVVWEARERARGGAVALKKLSLSDAAAIYGFKQEFRALADVAHENLVGLHELFAVGEELYIVMELVEGVDFLAWVRRRSPDEAAFAEMATLANEDPDAGADTMPAMSRPAVSSGAVDLARLRPALAELALGVLAIHRAKKLHRDIKPSNVLVCASGRVKILDFGLVAGAAVKPPRDGRVVGTPAYMSPEQAAGQPLGPASDWYSVGVILYEALTGTLPIDGDVREILNGKQVLDAPDPRAAAPGVPDDLAELCFGLLQRDPRARPAGAAVIRALGADPGVEPDLDVFPLVGREHHLALLERAFAATRAGRAVIVLLHGSSGMGKTALARRFLDGVVEAHGAVLLEGRSYERESVPYKALDPLIDGLADFLAGTPRAEVAPLLPPDVAALARLFPVLRKSPAIAAAPPLADVPDPQEVRRRASAALRALVGHIAARGPLLLSLDDLQWGDADSASILLDLVAAPDPPPILLLAGYRSEDAAAVDLAGALLRRMAHGEPGADVHEVFVGPLSPRESRTLARALLAAGARGADEDDNSDDVEAIARESGGSPFYVRELSRHALAVGRAAGPVSLRDVIAYRVNALPAPARRLLVAIAAAGRPTAVAAVERAADIEDAPAALSLLRAQHLVRTRTEASVREVEPFHDRIREGALARVPPADLADLHLGLGRALEDLGGADPEALAFHFEAGGDRDRARSYAEAAADRAAEALAFGRAAALYRRALPDGAGAAVRPLLVKLGHALSHAGRGAEAARAYLDACAGAPAAEALDLRRRAAEQFLRAGHVDEGLAVLRDVLAAVDLSLPRTPTRAFASLLYRRARLSLRGLEFQEREASPEELTRIDVCWSVGNGLNGVDIVRGADFQARHLLYALAAGDPYRISRALSSEAIFAAMEGGRRGPERARLLLARAREVAERIRHPHAIAWAAGAAAGATFYESRFADAAYRADEALRLFRGTCTDITWELGSLACWWLLPSLFYLGRLDDLSLLLPAYLKEAEELGALYNVTSLRTLTAPRVLLARDRPAEARREVDEAILRWSQRGWHVQHWCAMYSRANAALYEGDGIAAHTEVEGSWLDLDRSLLLRVESVRVESLALRGAAAIAAAGAGSEGEAAFRVAERAQRSLARETTPFAAPFAAALRAAVALARGHVGRALAGFEDAERAFGQLSMGLHAAAARRRFGEIAGGDEGRLRIEAADAWMRDRGVVRPDRLAAMLAPAPGGPVM